MLIAQPNGNTFIVAHYQELFPDTSFSTNGPNDQWFEDNNCYRVSLTKSYDANTEILVPCEPYLEEGIVYTVTSTEIPVANTPSSNT